MKMTLTIKITTYDIGLTNGATFAERKVTD